MARLYHLGADPVRRSTFSDANAQRPAAVFTGLLETMMKQAHRGLRRKLAETTYLIDATSARLSERSAGWARFSAGVCGAKVHVIYDADADRPIYAAVSAANVNDITAARQMPLEPGATYVFDLGYYDYAWWAELDALGCRIVTRFKSNTPIEVVQEMAVMATIRLRKVPSWPGSSRPSTSSSSSIAAKTWMPGIADKFTQSAQKQTAMAGHDGERSANGRHGKRKLKEIVRLRSIKLSRL